MREICTSGSGRGAARKSRPYRDYQFARLSGDPPMRRQAVVLLAPLSWTSPAGSLITSS